MFLRHFPEPKRNASIRLLPVMTARGYWLAQKRLSPGAVPHGGRSRAAAAKRLESLRSPVADGGREDVSRVRAAPMWRRVRATTEVKIVTDAHFSLAFQERLFHTAGLWLSSISRPGDRSGRLILYIRTLVEQYHEGEPPQVVTARLCESLAVAPGERCLLQDMVCRGLLLMLERAGQIARCRR